MYKRQVRGFQVFGDLGGHHLVAALQHQLAVHVRAGVDPVFDDVAQLVGHALGRAPAEGVLVQVDADHLVRGQVAVLDALAQAVGVDGLAEVVGIGDVGGLLGRGGQADLRGRAEVAEDVAPGRVFGGAAAVALVDDDEVEEVGRELLVDVAFFLDVYKRQRSACPAGCRAGGHVAPLRDGPWLRGHRKGASIRRRERRCGLAQLAVESRSEAKRCGFG